MTGVREMRRLRSVRMMGKGATTGMKNSHDNYILLFVAHFNHLVWFTFK